MRWKMPKQRHNLTLCYLYIGTLKAQTVNNIKFDLFRRDHLTCKKLCVQKNDLARNSEKNMINFILWLFYNQSSGGNNVKFKKKDFCVCGDLFCGTNPLLVVLCFQLGFGEAQSSYSRSRRRGLWAVSLTVFSVYRCWCTGYVLMKTDRETKKKKRPRE